MSKSFLFVITLLLCSFLISAQTPNKLTSSEIYESIKKLNFLGSALYIAAHPDDENTRFISYLANNVKARTGYLSLTRGDGGQNLIGAEIRELLGVIRTQELLEARRIDGGEQFFTRANDFGYSKHPDETLEIWNKKEVLADVVWVIRNFKPDVIINRFSHKPETFGKTHGHHTSSAVLSELAFDLAGDKTKYIEQLKYVDVWQPQREFFNTSWWFYGSKENFEKADKENMIEVEIGLYYPTFGLSNTEIASLSSSMHKSQGFGSTGTRGKSTEYLELVKGDLPKNKENIFDGINTTWTRVKGGKEIGEILSSVESSFNFKNPSTSVSELIKAYKLIQNLENKHWKAQKTKEIKAIIEACAGLYLEAVATESSATKGSEVTVKFEVVNRSNVSMKLRTIGVSSIKIAENPYKILENNVRERIELKGIITNDFNYTSPYWLREQGILGMYKVDDRRLIGKPETPRKLIANFFISFDGYTIHFQKNIVFKHNDPVKGEVYQPFEITPEVTVGMSDKVYIFSDTNSKDILVKVRSGKSNINGTVKLSIPIGWTIIPEKFDVKIERKGAQQLFTFKVIPTKNQSEGTFSPIVEIDGKEYSDELIEIDYNHIPFQSVLMPSKSKAVKLDIKKEGQLIGYIQGAGDEIPSSLRQIGYTVVELNENDILFEELKKFDAVIMGIRAYNTNENAKYYQNDLHKYVKSGGTMIVQYNTNHSLKVDEVSPLLIKISKDRVTDEFSEVRILAPSHEVMNFPNKITNKDFDGWVQERGLYFPNEWSSEFTPILSMNDKGETVKNGSLLIAKYGEGHFIYTGLSFFRELPAGIPGAYKLFANLLSVGKNELNQKNKN
ncbi:MAG: PIG-L family deacetylase [Flavobacteriaceae bacterium]|nr:PIG-L family deacetylase [Flavobacteriaceae bacterium]